MNFVVVRNFVSLQSMMLIVLASSQPALAQSAASGAERPALQRLSTQLSKEWKARSTAKKSAVISVAIGDDNPRKVSIYNSSGDVKYDDAAKTVIVRALPIKDAALKKGTELRVKFEPQTNEIVVSVGKTPDFGPYMAGLQKSVKDAWLPPKGSGSKSVKLAWGVTADGKFVNTKLLNGSGNSMADQAAFAAVKNVGKYRPLPVGSPDYVDIEFSFEYNKRGGK